MKMEHRRRVQDKKQKFKKICLIALPILLLLAVLAGTAGSVDAYQAKYHNYTALAQTGMQHLRTATTLLETLSKNPFDALTVSKAQHEFTAAKATFGQLNDGLKSLPGISTLIPVYGARLSAALNLAPLAIDLSQAGIAGCNILNTLITRFHDPVSSQGNGITVADVTHMDQEVQQIKTALHQAIDKANQIQPSDLQFDPRIDKVFATFRQEIPTLQMWLDNAEKLIPVLPSLLGVGTPANYLIEVLDSTELRPAGGFIGNYGIATFSGGRLIATHINDVDLLDGPFRLAGNRIPYPSTYKWFSNYLAGPSWSFRDSNLDADFPTAARNGELNYIREGGKGPLQGVIAITPALIERALIITGPIKVPEYSETVTSRNLIDRIHYYQLGPGHGSDLVPSPDGHSSLRKRFTELLAEHFLARVRQLPASSSAEFLQLMVNSVRSKDLQIYFNAAAAENVLQDSHLNAAIQAPGGDGLFVVDANVGANKANNLMTYALDDQVTIDAKGNAIHHTTINYVWTTRGELYNGSPLYQDYVRIYVPPGSLLQMQDRWKSQGTSQAFNREVWSGFFTLSYGQTRTITFVWTVPDATKKDANGWHYQYLIQRQAGVQWIVHLRVTLPSCAVVTNKEGELASASGKKQIMTLSQPLTTDMNVGVDYTC